MLTGLLAILHRDAIVQPSFIRQAQSNCRLSHARDVLHGGDALSHQCGKARRIVILGLVKRGLRRQHTAGIKAGRQRLQVNE